MQRGHDPALHGVVQGGGVERRFSGNDLKHAPVRPVALGPVLVHGPGAPEVKGLRGKRDRQLPGFLVALPCRHELGQGVVRVNLERIGHRILVRIRSGLDPENRCGVGDVLFHRKIECGPLRWMVHRADSERGHGPRSIGLAVMGPRPPVVGGALRQGLLQGPDGRGARPLGDGAGKVSLLPDERLGQAHLEEVGEAVEVRILCMAHLQCRPRIGNLLSGLRAQDHGCSRGVVARVDHERRAPGPRPGQALAVHGPAPPVESGVVGQGLGKGEGGVSLGSFGDVLDGKDGDLEVLVRINGKLVEHRSGLRIRGVDDRQGWLSRGRMGFVDRGDRKRCGGRRVLRVHEKGSLTPGTGKQPVLSAASPEVSGVLLEGFVEGPGGDLRSLRHLGRGRGQAFEGLLGRQLEPVREKIPVRIEGVAHGEHRGGLLHRAPVQGMMQPGGHRHPMLDVDRCRGSGQGIACGIRDAEQGQPIDRAGRNLARKRELISGLVNARHPLDRKPPRHLVARWHTGTRDRFAEGHTNPGSIDPLKHPRPGGRRAVVGKGASLGHALLPGSIPDPGLQQVGPAVLEMLGIEGIAPPFLLKLGRVPGLRTLLPGCSVPVAPRVAAFRVQGDPRAGKPQAASVQSGPANGVLSAPGVGPVPGGRWGQHDLRRGAALDPPGEAIPGFVVGIEHLGAVVVRCSNQPVEAVVLIDHGAGGGGRNDLPGNRRQGQEHREQKTTSGCKERPEHGLHGRTTPFL